MARLLRNFRNRRLNEPVDPENISYTSILESILELDQPFYLFPHSHVACLQTLCVSTVAKHAPRLFTPFARQDGELLLRERPCGPLDGLPPPLCDLLCDLLLWLRDPSSRSIPLYCVLSPYTRCVCLREYVEDDTGLRMEKLLATRTPRLVELIWTGLPVTEELLNLLHNLPELTVFITDQPANCGMTELLEHLASLNRLRVLQLVVDTCQWKRKEPAGIVLESVRDLRLRGLRCCDLPPVIPTYAKVFPALERLTVGTFSDSCRDESKLEVSEIEWKLKEMSLSYCYVPDVLLTPMPQLKTLTLDHCDVQLERFPFKLDSLALHHRLTTLTIRCTEIFKNRDDSLSVFCAPSVLSLHLVCERVAVPLVWLADTFPSVQHLSVSGRLPSGVGSSIVSLPGLRRLHVSCESSVLMERLLSLLPLHQLAELSLRSEEVGEGSQLALSALSPCERLSLLQLENYTDVSVPSGFQLPSVRQVTLRDVHGAEPVRGLLRALPRLHVLQLEDMCIVSKVWTPIFEELRDAGVELRLGSGCTVPFWRRGGVRVAVQDYGISWARESD